jgi:phosphotransferase family enzyme
VKLDLRLIVPDSTGRAILVAPGGQLPSAEVEGDDAVAAIVPVDTFLRDAWRFSRPVLETHPKWRDVPEGEPIPTLVTTEPAPPDWAPPTGLTFGAIPARVKDVPITIRPRAEELLAELRDGTPPPPLRPRWARHGWYDRATTWMRSAAAAAGRPLTGDPRPFFLRGISAVLRAPTEGPDLFLKAVFPPFHAEPVLTALLAGRFPEAVPRVVAIEPDEGWLIVEDIGSAWIGDLPDADRPAGLRRGAETLVGLQRSIGADAAAKASLLAAGAPHRSLALLPAAVDAAIGPAGSAVEGGLEPERAARVLEAVAESSAAVERLGLPESVVHGDFHSGNAADVGDRIVIIDWSDAAIGSPAVDFVTWISWSEGRAGELEAAAEAWTSAWGPSVDAAALRAHLDDVVIVGAAYQLVSYDGIRRALEPATQYTMIGGGAHFLKHLERILDRRAEAVPS